MALIACSECSKTVSSVAEICPHCGFALKRGFLGKAGTERALNVGCLLIIITIGFFFWVFRAVGMKL